MLLHDCSCYLPDHFSDVGRNQVSDELFHVIINGSAFFHCSYNGGEIVIGQDHLRGGLGHSCSAPHGDADLCLF